MVESWLRTGLAGGSVLAVTPFVWGAVLLVAAHAAARAGRRALDSATRPIPGPPAPGAGIRVRVSARAKRDQAA